MIRLANSWYRSVFSGRIMLSQSIGCSLVNPSLSEITSAIWSVCRACMLFLQSSERYEIRRVTLWKNLATRGNKTLFFPCKVTSTWGSSFYYDRGYKVSLARLCFDRRIKLTWKVAPLVTLVFREWLTTLSVACAPSSPLGWTFP